MGMEVAEVNFVRKSAIKGEPGTGYEGPEGGPFECGNCEYFDVSDSGCDQPDMKRKSKRKRLRDGRVQVEREGCCEYVDRAGREDDDSD